MNIFVLHSLNADTLEMWGQDVKEVFTNKGVEVFLPEFPIRADSTYGKFKDNLIEISTNNPEMIRKGIVGIYDSYTFTRTNAIFNDGSHNHCFAHSGEAIAFVGQLYEVEALRLEGDFADGIRGLDVTGMKIIDQDQIEAILVPVA